MAVAAMPFKSIVVSAPGKVILHGEHAVVYGKTAVAASLGLRTVLRLDILPEGSNVFLDLPNIKRDYQWTTKDLETALRSHVNNDELERVTSPSSEQLALYQSLSNIKPDTADSADSAVLVFLHLYTSIVGPNDKLPSIKVRITSKLPSGAGLGSSAAYSVCIATGLLLLTGAIEASNVSCDVVLSPHLCESGATMERVYSNSHKSCMLSAKNLDLVSSWALEGEKIFHGKPSGIDNAISIHGGALAFTSGNVQHLERIPQLQILLINTKVQRSTREVVSKLFDRYQKMPGIYSPIFESIGGISTQCLAALAQMAQLEGLDKKSSREAAHCFANLENLIDINQHLLSACGVSHPTLDTIWQVTSKYGFHSKLTGAGAGGCAFTLIKDGVAPANILSVCEELTDLGFECWETCIGSPGIVVHSCI